jgi:hypothetical protein
MAVFPADRNLYFYEAKSSARYSPATFMLVYTFVEIGFGVLAACAYSAIVSLPWTNRMKPDVIVLRLDECRGRVTNLCEDIL